MWFCYITENNTHFNPDCLKNPQHTSVKSRRKYVFIETVMLIMHCQKKSEFSPTTRMQIPDNDKHCELWCEAFKGRLAHAGKRIKEIHIIAKGESQLNLRTHPSSRTSAKVCTRVSSSPVGINIATKEGKACGRKNRRAEIKTGKRDRETQTAEVCLVELEFIIQLISLYKPKQCLV